ncbi:hypothetical protein Y032_0231g2994 [Ancylostoma ceylanicum]|uniref:Uncharacterized protein n=1 Tax=Ancylostoma ceylanicum TaxID=53326 RepID=A0A016SGP4_9BILA|nr:hypothetical protein Y032_0231g2994 [Ancylostoma ceylanicum]
MHLAGSDLQLHTDDPKSGQYSTEWNTTGIDVCKKGARNNIGLTLQVITIQGPMKSSYKLSIITFALGLKFILAHAYFLFFVFFSDMFMMNVDPFPRDYFPRRELRVFLILNGPDNSGKASQKTSAFPCHERIYLSRKGGKETCTTGILTRNSSKIKQSDDYSG